MRNFGDVHLFTPGPVNVPQNVLIAGAQPMLHHRTPEFSAVLKSFLEKYQRLVATKQDVLITHTSGRGAMEGVITNLFSVNDEIACVCNGKFGEMFAEMAQIHGLKVTKVCKDWLQEIDYNEIDSVLKSNSNIKAITVPHSETTTAMVADVKRIANIAKQYNVLTIVDGISSVGCLPVEFDAWGLDVLVSASQKGLMSPTGVAMVVLSDKAWEMVGTSTIPSYYINFEEIRSNARAARPETPGSTPVSLIFSLEEALCMIDKEGREETFKRHEILGRAMRAGVQAMGLELFPPNVYSRSNALTAIKVPAGFTSAQIRAQMKLDYGVQTAAGLGKDYKDTIIRIGHMGHVYKRDVITLIGALEATLYKMNILSDIGLGTKAAIQELIKE